MDEETLKMYQKHGLYTYQALNGKTAEEIDELKKENPNGYFFYYPGTKSCDVYTPKIGLVNDDFQLTLSIEKWKCWRTIKNIAVASFTIGILGAIALLVTYFIK